MYVNAKWRTFSCRGQWEWRQHEAHWSDSCAAAVFSSEDFRLSLSSFQWEFFRQDQSCHSKSCSLSVSLLSYLLVHQWVSVHSWTLMTLPEVETSSTLKRITRHGLDLFSLLYMFSARWNSACQTPEWLPLCHGNRRVFTSLALSNTQGSNDAHLFKGVKVSLTSASVVHMMFRVSLGWQWLGQW